MSKLQKIDNLLRLDHTSITDDDKCFFLREYTAGQTWEYGETNSLISNLKKSPSKRNTGEWHWKENAIKQCALELLTAITNVSKDWLKTATLVPMPPSKIVGDPEYDDRIFQMLRLMSGKRNYDVRQLIIQSQNMKPSHLEGARATILELTQNFQIDENIATPEPSIIGVFDDILTVGRHFRAAKSVLQERFGQIPVYGFFLARRVPDKDKIWQF